MRSGNPGRLYQLRTSVSTSTSLSLYENNSHYNFHHTCKLSFSTITTRIKKSRSPFKTRERTGISTRNSLRNSDSKTRSLSTTWPQMSSFLDCSERWIPKAYQYHNLFAYVQSHQSSHDMGTREGRKQTHRERFHPYMMSLHKVGILYASLLYSKISDSII